MNIYLTQETHKALCELFDMEYKPISFEPIELGEESHMGTIGPKNGMYGQTHTPEAKKIMAESASARFKGKSYEEFYGKHKAEELKKIRSEQLKGIDNSGKNNPRYDNKEYTFLNIITNEKITSTRYDFYIKYGINKGGVSDMVNKGITYKKWCVV